MEVRLMRPQEQEQIIRLLGKFAYDDDIYKLIDLMAIMYRTTSEDDMTFYDYMRVMLADVAMNK